MKRKKLKKKASKLPVDPVARQVYLDKLVENARPKVALPSLLPLRKVLRGY